MHSADVTAVLREPGETRVLSSRTVTELRRFFRLRIKELLQQNMVRHHPLGFYYAVDSALEVPLRYHVWPSDWALPASQAGGDIHDHIFELNSAILLGALRHEIFDFQLSAAGDKEILRVRYDGNRAHLLRGNEFGELRRARDEIFREGTAYRLLPGVIHRAEPVTLPVVTLVCAVPSEVATPRIVIQRSSPEPTEFPRSTLDAQEVELVISTIGSF